ncbi:E3 ubiquitin-protein ligase XB3-like isoform X2 [Musa acuminata AAA Group]|uniref:E3 ubiquitin-protein ligase XB3-like isoform X2 n=1 Tax=Musa acuminata AAA Group TaxID=214697 RepID=UPI0031E261C2
MGQGLSCASSSYDHDFFTAVQAGDLQAVDSYLKDDPSLLLRTTIYDRLSALHIAAANGRVEVLSMILDRSVSPDVLNRDKQTPLMLAAMHGKIECVQKLLDSGANILMFDSVNGRTCLHHAAYYGHSDCLRAILSAAKSTHVASSWGFARFVNVSDGTGATPLHLAARQKRPSCVHILVDNGALVCASTGRYGRMPYEVALKQNHGECAALLNPSAAEPLVWPSALKFISELDSETKALLEAALMEGNREREMKILKGTTDSLTSPAHSDKAFDDDVSEGSDAEFCSICFDRVCTIEVQDCRHQMCAQCTLAVCCHSKPNPTTLFLPSPACPFCRSSISRLVTTKARDTGDQNTTSKPRRFRHCSSEGSSSFKGLSSAVGSFGLMGCGSGRITDSSDMVDKL